MCTLIIGRNAVAVGTVLLAANRDENPGRPTDPPRVLNEVPRIVGGRDRLAGGTWLAVREGNAVVALLNRYDPSAEAAAPVAGRRSRGLLAVDVAMAPEETALADALAAVRAARYAPFTLMFASPRECWVLALDAAGEPWSQPVPDGWHVLTHRELDDPREPRAAYLAASLRDYRPRSAAEAEGRLAGLLREHGGSSGPAVCLHAGPMVTVSSSIVRLDEHGARYLHAEGRPCESAYADRSVLLAGIASGGERR